MEGLQGDESAENRLKMLEKERIRSRLHVLDELLAQGFSLEEISVLMNTTMEEIESMLKR